MDANRAAMDSARHHRLLGSRGNQRYRFGYGDSAGPGGRRKHPGDASDFRAFPIFTNYRGRIEGNGPVLFDLGGWEECNGYSSKASEKMSRTLFFSHRSIILIGESLARRGINDVLDAFSRNPRNRLKTYILVVKGNAGDILQVRYPYELVPAEGLKEMQIMQGEGVATTLRDFFIESASEGISPSVGAIEPALFFRSGKRERTSCSVWMERLFSRIPRWSVF
ncbi:hypothetical protein LJK88_21800 [Paenibacillus sp. P26]|nr:hypothetical protein LJK88_21800 [Paenibacillus sp. P26]